MQSSCLESLSPTIVTLEHVCVYLYLCEVQHITVFVVRPSNIHGSSQRFTLSEHTADPTEAHISF